MARILKAMVLIAAIKLPVLIPTDCAIAADLEDDRAAFLNLLSLVPDFSNIDRSEPLRAAKIPDVGVPYIWMVDYRAAERAAHAPKPADWQSLLSMDGSGFAAWSSAMSRFKEDPLRIDVLASQARLARAAPDLAPELAVSTHGLPKALGAPWFSVNRALILGSGLQFRSGKFRAHALTALHVGSNVLSNSSLETTLHRQGFATENLHGVTVWHRFDDGKEKADRAAKADILGSLWADPFGINHGSASRISLMDHTVFGSPYWGVAELMIKAKVGKQPSLISNADTRAAITAVTSPGVRADAVIQSAIIDPSAAQPDIVAFKTLGFVPEERLKKFADRLSKAQGESGKFPPYRLIVLADRQDGEEEVLVLGLVYKKRIDASAGARVLANRLRTPKPPPSQFSPPRPYVGWLTGKDIAISHTTYETKDRDRVVALVMLRQSRNINPQTGSKRGRMFRDLFHHILNGTADFLVVNR